MFPKTFPGFLVDSWWSLVGMCINSTKINQDFHRIPGYSWWILVGMSTSFTKKSNYNISQDFSRNPGLLGKPN